MLAFLTIAISAWLISGRVSVCVAENDTPIIGILAREEYLVNFTNTIPASYVKFVEGSGGRAVPIFVDQPRSYYEDLLNSLDGVVLPGGYMDYWKSDGYAKASNYIYDIAMEINDKGSHFPLWGVCLGMEMFVYISSNRTEYLTDCDAVDFTQNLKFVPGFETSRIYQNAPGKIIDILKNGNVAYNYHHFCVTVDNFASSVMSNTWKVLALSYDKNGLEFITTIEHRKYPFYGIHHHPEKSLYEHARIRSIPHGENATLYAQYYGNFFLNEARKSTNNFPNTTIEDDLLFYNYNPEYWGKKGNEFTQMYGFPQ